jgi:(1->4)-alpha-D-glucan 1-alpha-D-glucosylmutase
MLKAAKEAKVHTSWLTTNQPYEEALERFVKGVLTGPSGARLLAAFLPFQRRIARLGMINSLAQVTMKIGSPGVPDFYQGTELWDFSLVDPDNRRPVDYEARKKLLKKDHSDALKSLQDGRAKLHVIRKGLEVRKKHPALFQGARYTALYADEGREENLIAFSLSSGANSIVGVAPRLFSRLMEDGDVAPLGAKAWGDARLPLEGQYVNVLTDERHDCRGHVKVADLLASFPVALLVRP